MIPDITTDPRDFALWLLREGGSCPDIGGEWYRRGDAAVRFADHYDDLAPRWHTRRHATISIYPGGGWLVTRSHGPDQIFRSGSAADCVDALRAALDVRARWLAGEHCGEVGCRRCPS